MQKIDIQKNNFNFNSDINSKIDGLKRLQKNILEYESEIYSALKSDLNKSEGESFLSEVMIINSEINLFLKNLRKWSKSKNIGTTLSTFGTKFKITAQAYGQVLIVSPWNYPFQLALLPLIGAYASGNCIVLKLSEYAIESNKVIRKILEKSFNENDVLVYEGGIDTNKELFERKWDYIFFTGSSYLGKQIMLKASQYLTPLTLELGGKSPVIVSRNCNIELSAKRIAWGKILNAGQTCVAPDYILIDKQIKKEFVDRLMFYFEQFSTKETYPKIINETAFKRLKELCRGENIIYGGYFDNEKNSLSPTIIDIKDTNSRIMQEEIFAPILPIIEVSDIREAIDFVTEREKPLALYFFGTQEESKIVIQNTQSGSVAINDTIIQITNSKLPFGGVGNSGIGSYHGKFSFDTFTHYKTIAISSKLIDLKMKYPPYKISDFIKRILKR